MVSAAVETDLFENAPCRTQMLRRPSAVGPLDWYCLGRREQVMAHCLVQVSSEWLLFNVHNQGYMTTTPWSTFRVLGLFTLSKTSRRQASWSSKSPTATSWESENKLSPRGGKSPLQNIPFKTDKVNECTEADRQRSALQRGWFLKRGLIVLAATQLGRP